MSTVCDLIKGSLRLIGALATGETPPAEETSDALMVLNQMIDSWSTENLIIANQVREVFPLVAGTSAYTMGVGGDFNTARPIDFLRVLIQDSAASPAYELPMEVLTAEQFSKITAKQTQGTTPSCVYAEGTTPLETLNLYPVPSVAKNIVIYSAKPINQFTSINNSIDLPPGYLKALRYNLAVELAPEYGKESSPSIINGAIESKENIKRQNIRPRYLSCDKATLSRQSWFNYRTGQ